ncbi:MAG: hypothetical protein ACD_79C01403G0001 [uncultured bacterium]|nr:MAG: hypothetical protein ACD_79C01403G0001 [uncultured bacterium]
MEHLINSISGRLSLRTPQRRSLEILSRIAEIAPPLKNMDIKAALNIINSEFKTVTDFERDFPSLCFALATGVGKTRLMGAFISYLHMAKKINHFFVMAPNLTIYNKLIADFTPNTPKYVFKGISEFAINPPLIITGDNYESGIGVREGWLFETGVHINIFNISKINSEVRGGKAPKIKRLSEYIGQSYFDYLSNLPDLVLLMDESHRYRASAGIKAINELKPILGLELTATPFIESPKGPIPFKNVAYDFPLSEAMDSGFVKEPAVVTQKNFDPSQFSPDQLEEIKLKDGIRLHETTKVELETYARQTDQKIVKPFMLIIARDTTHAGELLKRIESDIFEGRYKGKVIQVDSSKTGAEEEMMIERLLSVERNDDPTEIVIHVNMLKEGWDVTNLYTIVPLRAANARTLVEQSIGRGLRLPYGKRTNVNAVDRLNIVAHDRFQEIIDEANRSDSPIRLKSLILDPVSDLQKTKTVVINSNLSQSILGSEIPQEMYPADSKSRQDKKPAFITEEERKIAETVLSVIKKHENLPTSSYLLKPEVREIILKETESTFPLQLEMQDISKKPDVKAIIEKVTNLVVNQTIDIPRILVVPKGECKTGFKPFKLNVSSIHCQPVERDLFLQYLRTHDQETLSSGEEKHSEARLEDYIIRGLMNFDDVSYDENADLLYDLAGQMVKHLLSYLSEKEALNVLVYHQKQLSEFIHVQMLEHPMETADEYEVVVSKGFTELKKTASTTFENEQVHHFRNTDFDKQKIKQMLFGGFSKCLYPCQKFDSDTERRMAVILENESIKVSAP